ERVRRPAPEASGRLVLAVGVREVAPHLVDCGPPSLATPEGQRPLRQRQIAAAAADVTGEGAGNRGGHLEHDLAEVALVAWSHHGFGFADKSSRLLGFFGGVDQGASATLAR